MCRKFCSNDKLAIATLRSVILSSLSTLHSKHKHKNLTWRSSAVIVDLKLSFRSPDVFPSSGYTLIGSLKLSVLTPVCLGLIVTFKWNHNGVEARRRPIAAHGRTEGSHPSNGERLIYDWVLLKTIPLVRCPVPRNGL
jgi:hypothetical protein